MAEVIGIIIAIVLSSIVCVAVLEWFSDYCELKRRVEERDDFEKLMRKQLELDAARLKAQEDLLREACRSQAEEYDDGYEED